jgi:hypothetical protein
MKEQYIPTKDLKTSVEILGVVVSRTAEALKPAVKRELGKRTLKILQVLNNR